MDSAAVRKFFEENDQMAKLLGCEIVDIGEGSASVRMPVRRELLNGVGTLHGGALFSMADYAFAIAVNSHGKVAVALTCSVSFLQPGRLGSVLLADAKTVAVTNRTALIEVRISDEKGQLIGSFQGTAYRSSKDLSEIA
ncbi:MAG: hydroxyphenylacetyl-CoA thioesterase PaaI [Spirochaetaceae bacterium]|nr:MAG: hydroxyphenylacetyl-CoA thioesterase PaaI [Spirochaetaceae bacterium]